MSVLLTKHPPDHPTPDERLALIELTESDSDEAPLIEYTDRNRRGRLVHHVVLRRIPLDDIDILENWQDYHRRHPRADLRVARQQWLYRLARTTDNLDEAREITWCQEGCGTPLLPGGDGVHSVSDGYACDDCISNYNECYRCEEMHRYTSTTVGDDEICESCRDGYYSYCDDCEGWYHDQDADQHQHSGDSRDDGCCTSPALDFSIRNDGDPRLRNDERATVELPAGVISAEGIVEIARFIYQTARGMSHTDPAQRPMYQLGNFNLLTDTIGMAWQTKRGNFTKRLSAYAYKEHQLKLPAALVSQIGCIARDHSNGVSYDIEVTRDLNMSARDMGNSGSCWWGGYSESRCALKTNGGFALRSFNEHGVNGRAWVLPLKQTGDPDCTHFEPCSHELTPTFDTDAPAFVVFNGYGELSGYAPARILAHMMGMTYRKIDFGCSPMYVNSGGYLVASEQIATNYTDGEIDLDIPQHANLYDIEREELSNVA